MMEQIKLLYKIIRGSGILVGLLLFLVAILFSARIF